MCPTPLADVFSWSISFITLKIICSYCCIMCSKWTWCTTRTQPEWSPPCAPSALIFASKILARSSRKLTIYVIINNTNGFRVSQKFEARIWVCGRIADGHVEAAIASSFQNALGTQFCCAAVGRLHTHTCGQHLSIVSSASFLAEISARLPGKLYIFIILKNLL